MDTLNNNSRIKIGKSWKIIIKYILPVCIFSLWVQGILTTFEEEDPVSITIRVILLAVILILPFILSRLPAKNEDFYEKIQ